MTNPEAKMLTAAKIAQELDISASQVRKAIKEAGIKPDLVKSGCSYYSQETFGKLRKLVNQ